MMNVATFDFTLDNDANACGTSFHDVRVTVDPKKLLALFESAEGDEYKVSRNWTFVKGDMVFTLYDWKETSLYDEYNPSPRQYWAQDKVTLHVGHLREHTAKAQQLAAGLEQLCK